MVMDLKLALAVARFEAIWLTSVLRILYEPTLTEARCHQALVGTIHPSNDFESEIH
jgi:hypothetical protein